MTIPKEIALTGKAYIDYLDNIQKPLLGDILLTVQFENKVIKEINFEDLKHRGIFKPTIFDGKFWQAIDSFELFPEKENHFTKKEKPIFTAKLLVELISQNTDIKCFRSYRGHYTLKEYEKQDYIRKKSHMRKKK